MNRLKKELRRRGVKLESDYEYLPFPVRGKSPFEPGYISVQGVFVNSETATVTVFYNVADIIMQLKRNGEIAELWG